VIEISAGELDGAWFVRRGSVGEVAVRCAGHWPERVEINAAVSVVAQRAGGCEGGDRCEVFVSGGEEGAMDGRGERVFMVSEVVRRFFSESFGRVSVQLLRVVQCERFSKGLLGLFSSAEGVGRGCFFHGWGDPCACWVEQLQSHGCRSKIIVSGRTAMRRTGQAGLGARSVVVRHVGAGGRSGEGRFQVGRVSLAEVRRVSGDVTWRWRGQVFAGGCGRYVAKPGQGNRLSLGGSEVTGQRGVFVGDSGGAVLYSR
jgi:hypothetical protein